MTAFDHRTLAIIPFAHTAHKHGHCKLVNLCTYFCSLNMSVHAEWIVIPDGICPKPHIRFFQPFSATLFCWCCVLLLRRVNAIAILCWSKVLTSCNCYTTVAIFSPVIWLLPIFIAYSSSVLQTQYTQTCHSLRYFDSLCVLFSFAPQHFFHSDSDYIFDFCWTWSEDRKTHSHITDGIDTQS